MTHPAPTPLVVENSTPYPWPFDAAPTPSRLALVVTGWNVDWWRRCHDPGPVAETILRLAAAVERVICVDHPSPSRRRRWATPSGCGSPPPVPAAVMLSASGVDGFHGGPLDCVLRDEGRDQLAIAGLGLETTVHSTMRSANDRGLECLLVVDACAPLDPTMAPRSTSMVEMSGGIFGAVGHADALLALLSRLTAPFTALATPTATVSVPSTPGAPT